MGVIDSVFVGASNTFISASMSSGNVDPTMVHTMAWGLVFFVCHILALVCRVLGKFIIVFDLVYGSRWAIFPVFQKWLC